MPQRTRPIRLLFPAGGIHRGRALADSDPITCDDALNVRTFDRRLRSGGGSRPPLRRTLLNALPAGLIGLEMWRVASEIADFDPGELPGPGDPPEQWVRLGLGVNDDANSIVRFDALPTFGGAFTQAGGATAQRVAQWLGDAWQAVGSHPAITSISLLRANLDGEFKLYSGQASLTGGIQVWDGSSWTQFAETSGGAVNAMRIWDNKLVVAGAFTQIGPPGSMIPANRIAIYDPVTDSWSALGDGLNGTAWALEVFDIGVGPHLIVGGAFTQAGGVGRPRIARWDGGNWNSLADGIDNGEVRALRVWDGNLYVGGTFTELGGVAGRFLRVARWDGSSWHDMAWGLGGSPGAFSTGVGANEIVRSLTVFDDGEGPALWASGFFMVAGTGNGRGTPAACVARWDGSSWRGSRVGFHGSGASSGSVHAIRPIGDAFQSSLYVGGAFDTGNGIPAWAAVVDEDHGIEPGPFIIKRLHPPGANSKGSAALAASIGAVPPSLYVTAAFSSGGAGSPPFNQQAIGWGPGSTTQPIARWDGAQLHAMGADFAAIASSRYINGLGVWNSVLYATGLFAGPGTNIASWNGAAWSNLTTGLNAEGNAITVFDDGMGEALYVGGANTQAGGGTVNRIAGWDGAAWFGLQGSGETAVGVNGVVHALATDGSLLVLGGAFTAAGDGIVPATRVVGWNGTDWIQMGDGFNNTVRSLVFFDGDFYAAGAFTQSGATGVLRVARWTGTAWQQVGAGFSSNACHHLVVANGRLYALGSFANSGAEPMPGLAVLSEDKTSWEPVVSADRDIRGYLNIQTSDQTAIGAEFQGGLHLFSNMTLLGADTGINHVARAARLLEPEP